MLFVQDQAKAMDHFDDRVKTLQNRSLQVLPLKYRREAPQKLVPVEALCDFDTEEVLNTHPLYSLANPSFIGKFSWKKIFTQTKYITQSALRVELFRCNVFKSLKKVKASRLSSKTAS